ncbi:MAG: carboxypeptidase-like regulatory domain-containing protein [Thermoplasmata archaeon]
MKRRKMDNHGALEGLPLYLIILVVVAGIGTAILAGWMMSSRTSELDHISVKNSLMKDSWTTNTVTAYDQNGNPLEGVTVTLSGCGVDRVGETGSNGEIKFDDLEIELPPSDNFGTIDVTARYTGSITTTKTAVITVSVNDPE